MQNTRSPSYRRPSTKGSTRLFLVAVLVAAAVLLGASLLVIMSGDDPAGEDDTGVTRTFAPDGELEGRNTGRTRYDPERDDPEYDADGILEFPVRSAHGPEFIVTADTIRQAIESRHWEEIRRMIDVFQESGHEVPADVVDSLIAFFDGEDTRLDAILALGQVKSDAAGLTLAQRAADVSWPLEVRAAALQALEKNGIESALTTVRALTESAETDPKLLRYAYMALGGIGGRDAAASLVESLRAHKDTALSGVIILALGRAEGSGAVLAQAIRDARTNGDDELVSMVIRAAHMNGERADDELRHEIRRMIVDPTATEFAADDREQLGLRGSALAAAAAIGGDLVDPVIAVARDDTDGLSGIALHSLRQARGDEAARKIATLLQAPRDDVFEREVAVALGETGSYEATDHLVRLLDAEKDNTRRAAANGLVKVRDPKATKPILDRLDAETDHTMLQSYIDALGRIGSNDALPKLEELRDSDEQRWKNVQNHIRRSIYRIKSGNPDAARMD